MRVRTQGRAVLLVLAAALVAPLDARETADPPAARTQVALEARHESLDGGMEDWHGLRLGVSHGGGWAPGWHGALVHEVRFGLEDAGVELGGAMPLDNHWMLQADLTAAPGARFLPGWGGEVRLVRRFRDGWLATGGVRHAHYRTARVDKAGLDVERYFGKWRVGYGIDVARLRGEHLPNHEVSVDRYYGARNVAGLRLGMGEDAILQPDGTLLPDDARAGWLRGTHWVGASWAIDWAAGHVGQDATYDRDWIQVGIRREF